MQWMFREEVDVVSDNHQVTNLEVRVHAPSCIAYEEGLDAQLVHHTDREGHLLHGVPLVVVETSLHGQDVLATQFAHYEATAVSLYGADGHVGDVVVTDACLDLYLFCQPPQTGAQDDGRLGLRANSFLQPLGCFLNLCVHNQIFLR